MALLARMRAAFAWLAQDIKSAALTMLGIMIVYLVGRIYVGFLLAPARLVTDSPWLQGAVALGMLLIIGFAIRKMRDIRWAAWLVQFLPTAPLEQPEVRFRVGKHYVTGILIDYETIPQKGVAVRYGRVAAVNAGPTSISLLSPRLIRAADIEPTGRTLKDVAKELATLGAAKAAPPRA
jgi:hypothetical protein